MIYKERSKPFELKIFEFLKPRMKLITNDEQRFINLSKGYEGELLFDIHFEQLQSDSLILNDLLLEVNNTTFQIDSLIILNNQVYFYEIKYFEGDYYFRDDKFFKKPNFEVINPLHQLGRSESLLRQLLLNIGFNPKIISNVIFVHPSFTLYEAPLGIPFIFPTQIKRHLKDLNRLPSKITNRHEELAKQLVDMHIVESRFTQLPRYDFAQLRKGLSCTDCCALSVRKEGSQWVCHLCGKKETMSDAVLHAVKEYQILFPDRKLTTGDVFIWSGELISKDTIRRVLLSNYRPVIKGRSTYYN